MSNSRENILQKVKQALATPVPLPFPEENRAPVQYPTTENNLKQEFEATFTGLQGTFYNCENEVALTILLQDIFIHKNWTKIYCKDKQLADLLQKMGVGLHDSLASCDVAVTDCEALVSRTGTIVLSAAQAEGRTASVYAPAHLCVATSEQLYYDIGDALSFLKQKYKGNLPSFITFASGPSRTADIEKTLVTGVHGPKEVTCIIVQ